MTRAARSLVFLALGSAVAALACAAPTPSPAAPGTGVEVRRSALTTNVFVTDPRLFGIRLTKNW